MNFKFNISKRIAIGYIIILLVAIIASIVSIIRLQDNTSKYRQILNVYMPSISNLKELQALSKESNKLVENWIYISNKEDKERLRTIQLVEYPTLKFDIKQSFSSPENADLHNAQLTLLNDCDTIFKFQKKIMAALATPQQYTSDSMVDIAINIINHEITPRNSANQFYLNTLLDKEAAALKQVEADLDKSYSYLTLTMIVMLMLIILVGVVASYIATTSITKPIKDLKNVILELSKGELPVVLPTGRQDEIGEMTNAISAMSENLNIKAEFALKTGEGNYNTGFEMLSKKDILGLALVQMSDNLKKNAVEDAGRNWLNSGLNTVSDMLRLSEDNNGQMNVKIINFLTEYIGAQTGALFVVNEHASGILELVAGYAIEVNYKESKKINFGNGLTGQTALEKKTLLVNDMPDGFMKIATAFGEVNPKSLIAVPLVFENEVKGIIEFASAKVFTDLQKEFLEITSRNIAITLDLIARKKKTENLLNESRELNEKLTLNEIELKGANEELSTFIYRASHDLRGPLSTILGLANVSTYEQVDGKGAEYLKMIGERATQLDRILLVLLKTISIKDEVLKINAINFNSMFRVMVDSFKKSESGEKTKFITKIDSNKPFYSDFEILNYALFNIIENAVKFQNRNLPESFILVEVSNYHKGLKIGISDNGVGMKKEMQNKIFEMFYKGKSRENGFGLGLYVAKKAITKLKGTIEFSSEEGNGTFVTIYLPSLVEANRAVTFEAA